MDDAIPTTAPESDAERTERLAWEREALAKAKQQHAAGLVVDGEEVVAWLRSLGTPGELPQPEPADPAKP